jgi:lysophospholipase L1-like esterase
LENILRKKRSSIEVNNCGTGGYNSADILVRFLLQTIETKPDLVIIYHAYNDIKSYLTQNFQEDYSHSRINLGEQYWRFKLRNIIPDLPIKFYNYLVNNWFPSNVRYSLLDIISKGKFDLELDYKKGLKVYERNLQNLIYIFQKNNINIILSSYCFYLHEDVKNSKLNKIYQKIVTEENRVIEELAQKNNIKFVDCDSKIPKNIEYFLDTVHLTPKGMQFVANEISKAVDLN